MMDMMCKIKLRQINFGGVCWKKPELIFKKIPTTISGKFLAGLAFPPLKVHFKCSKNKKY